MYIDLILKDPRWQTADIETCANAAGDAVQSLIDMPTELSLLATDDTEIATLNGDFRGKPNPTNVLSWPAQDLAPDSPGTTPPAPEQDPFEPETSLGDIAISYDTCLREAQEQGKPIKDHVTHLILHGMLHLLGYDHETEQDAALMEGIERKLLGQMGIKDPYA